MDGGSAEPQQKDGVTRFFGSVIDAINPVPAIQEYINRPNQWKAVSDVLSTNRGSAEESAALERGMQAPLSNPMGQTLPVGMEPIAGAVEQAGRGDIAGAAGTLTGGYAVPIAAGAAALKVKSALATKSNPASTLVRALKPRASSLDFRKNLDRAMPEIKASEANLGRPIAGVDDLLEATKDAKARVWQQYEQIAGGQRMQNVSGAPIADAIEKSIPSKLRLENPGRVTEIKALADKYRRTFRVDELEQLLIDTNAELDSFYQKYPGAKQATLRANPETAHTVAQAEAIRKTIYNTLDEAGEGAAPRELKKRYGSILGVEEEAYRRKNVAARQQPESLSEQLGKWHAAGQAVKGSVKLMSGDVGGAADIAQAVATRKAASWLKEQQTTDALIRRAFGSFKGAPTPVPFTPPPAPPEPAGLLTAPQDGRIGGAIVTPPPADPSGIVRNAPGPRILQREPAPVSRQLPAPGNPPIVTPPPTDPSGVFTVPAQPGFRSPSWVSPRRALGQPDIITPPPMDPSNVRAIPARRMTIIDPKTGKEVTFFVGQ